VADFVQVKCDFVPKSAVLRCWTPFGGLRGNVRYHLRLIGKRMVDFLLVFIELFSLGVTAEALYERIGLLDETRRFRYNGGQLTQYFR